MVSMEDIQDVSRRIAEEFRPQRVILFGSYAQGIPTEDSDVDLLVIMSFEGRSVDKSVEMRLKLRPPFPMDLLVRRPEEVRRRIEMGDLFLRDVLTEGKVLYESGNG
ncbi:MAG TPA: nucleotidyltransferase domain-containing protein [Phycisphaerae bacterium]|nr:nucleotidyltransferase domain-containing protein [Phycisphaerae bacterium]